MKKHSAAELIVSTAPIMAGSGGFRGNLAGGGSKNIV
jgi:hypothetical protein